MCFRLAYPNGLASDDVTAIKKSGMSIALEGNIAGTLRFEVLGSRGADETRYAKPVRAANADWMVLRKMEYVKRACVGPYVVVVMRSWRTAQERLGSLLIQRNISDRGREGSQTRIDTPDTDGQRQNPGLLLVLRISRL